MNVIAVAQYRQPVANREDLFEAMRDINDADTFPLQPTNHLKEIAQLIICQRCRRLIHRQYADVSRKRLCYLNKLPFGDTERTDRDGGINILTKLRKQCFRAFPHRRIINQGKSGPGWLVAQADILRNREFRYLLEILIDHTNAVAL